MSRHVLITRAADDAAELAARVEQAGFIPVIAPLLAAATIPGAVPALDNARAVVFTSARAVRAVSHATNIPVFAVGSATAQVAKDLGFTRINTAGGDIAALQVMLAQADLPGDGPVYYLSGAEITAPLAVPGMAIERHIVYRVALADRFPDSVETLFRAGDIAALTLMSRRTGQACAAAVGRQGLIPCLSTINALCLSDSVLESVAHLPWRAAAVAGRPDMEGLCALLASGSL